MASKASKKRPVRNSKKRPVRNSMAMDRALWAEVITVEKVHRVVVGDDVDANALAGNLRGHRWRRLAAAARAANAARTTGSPSAPLLEDEFLQVGDAVGAW